MRQRRDEGVPFTPLPPLSQLENPACSLQLGELYSVSQGPETGSRCSRGEMCSSSPRCSVWSTGCRGPTHGSLSLLLALWVMTVGTRESLGQTRKRQWVPASPPLVTQSPIPTAGHSLTSQSHLLEMPGVLSACNSSPFPTGAD